MNLDCRDSSEAFQAKRWGLNFLLQDEVIITQKTVKILPVHDIFSSRNLHTFLQLMEEMEGVASLLILCQERRKFVKKWVNLTCYEGEICVMCHDVFNWGLVNLHYKQTPLEGGFYHRWESLVLLSQENFSLHRQTLWSQTMIDQTSWPLIKLKKQCTDTDEIYKPQWL